MCGILGIIGANSIDRKCLNLLQHRGPDASGLWISPAGEVPVSLGHTRLSIIGLDETGNQPMESADGNYVFVFNGEIYNFLELREQLEQKGYRFVSETDTEVILYGLISEGPSFMQKCNGMWAFCLWDRKGKKALFGRDRFGKKPLFYTFLDHGKLAFASEMKALFPMMKQVKPDRQINLHFSFLFDYEHTQNCVIEGIKRIPPGFFAEFDLNDFTLKRWWNTLDHLELVPEKYSEQVEKWRELFIESVQLRMRADVKIGTALSGGLDSSATFSTMAYIAAQNQSNPRQATDWQYGFCSHYPGSSLDETKWAEIVTNAYGVQLQKVQINPLQAGWSVSESLFQVEDPYLTLPLPMLATYKAISEAGIRVTLDGHGADELFSGYGHLKFATLQATPKETAEIFAIQKSTQTGVYSPDYNNLKLRWLAQRIKMIAKLKSEHPRKIARKLLGKIDWEAFHYQLKYEDQDHPAFKEMGIFNQQLYEIFHITILPTLLRNYDRYSMANGVEVRMPFMDWRLVTFTFSLPWQSKIGGGLTKRIMRDAMKGILPEEIRLRRDKIGWNAPLHEWLKAPMRAEIESFLHHNKSTKELLKKWHTFQQIENPSYLQGEKMWRNLLPGLWSFAMNKEQ